MEDYTYYYVKKGDDLSKIAKRFLNSDNHREKIFKLNRDIIDDPDLIYPGQVLKIPSAFAK